MFTLHKGDCLPVLKSMPDKSVDLILTDFPYGVEVDYQNYNDTRENLIKLIADCMPEFLRVAKRTVFTCGIANVHLFPPSDWILSWAYSGGGSSGKWGFNVWQPLLVYGDDPYLSSGKGRRPDMVYKTETSEKNGHPCPKPLGVWSRFVVRCSLEGETVFDPFMGSGTTGVACVQHGRSFIGCELSPEYFSIAEKRIKQAALEKYSGDNSQPIKLRPC